MSPVTSEVALRMRSRGLTLPLNIGYIDVRVAEIARKQDVLFCLIEELDQDLHRIANERRVERD